MIIAEIGHAKFAITDLKQAEQLLNILASTKSVETHLIKVNGIHQHVVADTRHRLDDLSLSILPGDKILSLDELEDLRELNRTEKLDIAEPPSAAEIND